MMLECADPLVHVIIPVQYEDISCCSKSKGTGFLISMKWRVFHALLSELIVIVLVFLESLAPC